MMRQFKKIYWFGGMGLDHSAWWLVQCEHDSRTGTFYIPLRKLARSDYS